MRTMMSKIFAVVLALVMVFGLTQPFMARASCNTCWSPWQTTPWVAPDIMINGESFDLTEGSVLL